MELSIIKVFLPTALAFFIGIAVTPLVTKYLYKYKAWKKVSGKSTGYGGGGTPIFNQLHEATDTNTPRLGGTIIWLSILLTIFLLAIFQLFWPDSVFAKLNFLSRSQTWLPLFSLCVGAIVGFIDDVLVIRGGGKHFAGGLPLTQRLLVVGLTATFSAWWFYEKLGVSSINLIGHGELHLGWLFIPFFIIIALSVYASSVIDGIDGLSGGVFMFIFAAYSGIAILQEQYDIAALCATIVGGILAFLWFNVPPARFYMTETGVMALTMTLTTIAFLTDKLGGGEGVSVLPIIGFLLVVTVASDIIQVLSKKIFGKKVFLIAPIHHHFEALGWPSYKVTMRYWILGFIFAVLGILLTLVF